MRVCVCMRARDYPHTHTHTHVQFKQYFEIETTTYNFYKILQYLFSTKYYKILLICAKLHSYYLAFLSASLPTFLRL